MILQNLDFAWARRYQQDYAEALYIHIPFCKKKCLYCDFATWTERPESALFDSYTDAVIKRIELYRTAGILDERLKTAYIGGGTPSFLGKENLSRLIRTIHEYFLPVELTFEANPESSTYDLLADAKAAGATRVSFGVQTTSTQQLKLLGRIHTNEQAEQAIRDAAALGLRVSADIMCATEDLSEADLSKSIEDVLSFGTRHVSVYPLQIEPGTALHQKTVRKYKTARPSYNDPDVQARHMQLAEEILLTHDFSRYEVASYATAGEASVHNQIYWQAKPYIAIGTGASSMVGPKLYRRLQSVHPILTDISDDSMRVRIKEHTDRKDIAKGNVDQMIYETEELELACALSEDLMLDTRMSHPMDKDLYEMAKALFGNEFSSRIDSLVEQGLLDENFAPTERGWLLGDEIARTFIELEDVTPVLSV